METIFRTDSLLLRWFTVYLTCSGYHYICFTYITLFFHLLHSGNPCLYNFIFSWSCSAQISAGMQLWVLVLLKSPVINKPLPLLSAGSAATTKKICLSGMSVNQPQQRSRRISIILTPNLTVSNSECRDTSLHICLVDVCWACLPLCSCLQGRVDLCAEMEHKGSEFSSGDCFFTNLFIYLAVDLIWIKSFDVRVLFFSVMDTAHSAKPSIAWTFPAPSRTWGDSTT